MLSKSHPIILFIDRFGFSVYQDILINIPKFNFTPDLVSNLDVIDKDQLVTLITTFIQINKIIGSSLAVILSDDVIYVKDLENPVQKSTPAQSMKTNLNNDKENEDEVQTFLENIPFENILAKVIKTQSVNRAVAVNKDLVMAIVDTFVEKGSNIEAVIPSFMYGQNVNFAAGLTSENVHAILGNLEVSKSGNLLTDQEKMTPSQNLENELKNSLANVKPELAKDTKKKKSNRQYLLVGVFVILLVILAIVYFASASNPLPKSYKQKSPGVAAVTPTLAPTPISMSPAVAPVDPKAVNIIISHNASSSEIAATLKTHFSEIGLKNVTEEVSEVSVPDKSSIIFPQGVLPDLRNSILLEIKEAIPEISVLEIKEANNTINILIGKS